MSLTKKDVKDIFLDILDSVKTVGSIKHESFVRRKKGTRKKSEKKLTNTYHNTMPFAFNLLLVITGKRLACMETTDSMIINSKVINEFKKIEKEFQDECLGFEYHSFKLKSKMKYIVIFFNTKKFTHKYVYDAISSFHVSTKTRKICPCLACNGGKAFVEQMRIILNYPNVDTDCLNGVYYVGIDVHYKRDYFLIINYRSMTYPDKTKLLKLYKDFNSILNSVGAKLEISISMHEHINDKTKKC